MEYVCPQACPGSAQVQVLLSIPFFLHPQLDCSLPQPRGHQHLREEPAILRADPEAGSGLDPHSPAQTPQLLPARGAGQSRGSSGAGGSWGSPSRDGSFAGNGGRQLVREVCRAGVALGGCRVKLGASDPKQGRGRGGSAPTALTSRPGAWTASQPMGSLRTKIFTRVKSGGNLNRLWLRFAFCFYFILQIQTMSLTRINPKFLVRLG